MAYVFFSHASEDKPRAKPLVEALAMQGVRLWLDRPYHGDNHFNFTQAVIERYGIRCLSVGADWPEQVSSALRGAGAVLVCLSEAVRDRLAGDPDVERTVLVHEILIAAHAEKFVACIVDGLALSELPREIGLINLSNRQAVRIQPDILQQAIDEVHAAGGAGAPSSAPALAQWEIVRQLVSDINGILSRHGPLEPTPERFKAARTALVPYPIGRVVQFYEVPAELIGSFADLFDDPREALRLLAYAMRLRSACNPEGFSEDQILVRAREVPRPGDVSSIRFWEDVMAVAAHKSQRTLAALCIAPGSLMPRRLPEEHERNLSSFLEWLKQ